MPNPSLESWHRRLTQFRSYGERDAAYIALCREVPDDVALLVRDGLRDRDPEDRALAVLLGIVQCWTEPHSRQRGTPAAELATPLVLALKRHCAAEILALADDPWRRSAFVSASPVLAVVHDADWVAAEATLQRVAQGRDRVGDDAAFRLKFYFVDPSRKRPTRGGAPPPTIRRR